MLNHCCLLHSVNLSTEDNPTGREARAYSMDVRGERYRKHAESQATRLRWRGMEEFDASREGRREAPRRRSP